TGEMGSQGCRGNLARAGHAVRLDWDNRLAHAPAGSIEDSTFSSARTGLFRDGFSAQRSRRIGPTCFARIIHRGLTTQTRHFLSTASGVNPVASKAWAAVFFSWP